MPAERAARHTRSSTARRRRQVATWLTALAFLGFTAAVIVLWRGAPALRVRPEPTAGQAQERMAAVGWPPSPPAAPQLTDSATRKPLLSPKARRLCPRTADACVDLSEHLTWLQSSGRVSYGPVPMEPGPPGTAHATPRGTFHVAWKAGAHYASTEYHEPMPYAVFFTPDGIAFHGGSLTRPSHGCVHLGIGSARYYHDHLPVGAEVIVF